MDEKYPKEDEKKTFKQSLKKMVLITNRNNYPYDLHLGRSFYRLEPRGKLGDSINLDSKLVKKEEVESKLKKIIIKEL